MKLHWGNYIFIFFVIFLGLAAVFITFAMKQNNDLVTKDYYQQGANYSVQMEMDKRSAKFDDAINLAQQGSEILFTAPDSLIEQSVNFNIHFYRPSNQELDFKVQLPLNSDSILIATDELAQGRYIVKINWQMSEQTYYLQKDIRITK